MPRQPRLVLPGLPIHAVHRGNNRHICFGEGGDFLTYLALLLQGSGRHGVPVHAYCLMSNHVHLLFTPATRAACESFMHGIAQRYAYYYNRKYERTGTLWEGRFRSAVVASDEYLLACYRYIELNPVRAGIVEEPLAYRWSSHSGNVGAREDPLLAPHPQFSALGRSAYVELVTQGMDSQALAEIRDATNGGYPLASESVRSAIGTSTGKKTERGRPGRPSREKEGKSVAVPDLVSGGGVS